MLCSLRGVSDFIIQEALQPVSLSFQRVGKRQPRVRGSWDEELQEEPDRSLGNMKAADLSTPDRFKFPSPLPVPAPLSPLLPLATPGRLGELKSPQRWCQRRQWQPAPVFLPGESRGRQSLVGCRLWGRRVGHDRSDLAAAAAAAEVVYFAEPPGLTSACSQGRCPGAEGKEGN